MEQAIQEAYIGSGRSEQRESCVLEYALSRDLMAMTRVLEEPGGRRRAYCKGAPEAVLSLCTLSQEEYATQMRLVETLGGRGYRVLAAAKQTQLESDLPQDQRSDDCVN